MLVRRNPQRLRLQFKRKLFGLVLGAFPYVQLDVARDLVGIADFELLDDSIREFRRNEGPEEERFLLDCKDRGIDHRGNCRSSAQRLNHYLLLEDLLEVLAIDAGHAALRDDFVDDSVGLIIRISPGNVDSQLLLEDPLMAPLEKDLNED